MKLRILKKGIKIDGKYFPCHYSGSKNNLNAYATIYLKGVEPLPDEAYKELDVQNNTELQSDYFERDRIRIAPDSPYFAMVEALS